MWYLITLIHTNTYLKVDNMPTIGFEIKRKCKVCGKVFVAKTLDSHYCSPKCGKVAWKRKKDAKDRNAKLEAIAQQVSDIREYISVKEAVAMFGVERSTLYRLIKLGRIPTINMGTRLTRIKRSEMERLFLNRSESIAEKEKPAPLLSINLLSVIKFNFFSKLPTQDVWCGIHLAHEFHGLFVLDKTSLRLAVVANICKHVPYASLCMWLLHCKDICTR